VLSGSRLAWAASTAARASVPARDSGNTIPGSTTTSSSGSTGSVKISFTSALFLRLSDGQTQAGAALFLFPVTPSA
jgi:hypothetical protein